MTTTMTTDTIPLPPKWSLAWWNELQQTVALIHDELQQEQRQQQFHDERQGDEGAVAAAAAADVSWVPVRSLFLSHSILYYHVLPVILVTTLVATLIYTVVCHCPQWLQRYGFIPISNNDTKNNYDYNQPPTTATTTTTRTLQMQPTPERVTTTTIPPTTPPPPPEQAPPKSPTTPSPPNHCSTTTTPPNKLQSSYSSISSSASLSALTSSSSSHYYYLLFDRRKSAYAITNFVLTLVVTFLGFYYQYPAAATAAAGGSVVDSSLLVRANFAGHIPPDHGTIYLSAIQMGWQLWAIPVGYFHVHETMPMLFHHLAVIGATSTSGILCIGFRPFTVFFYGQIEISTIVLILMNLYKERPHWRQRPGDYQCYTAIRVVFGLLFLYWRVVWWVPYQLELLTYMTANLYELVLRFLFLPTTPTATTMTMTNTILQWLPILYYLTTLLSSILLTCLQLFWATLILKGFRNQFQQMMTTKTTATTTTTTTTTNKKHPNSHHPNNNNHHLNNLHSSPKME